MIPPAFFLEMVKALAEHQSILSRVMIGLRLRRKMSALYRLHPVQLCFIRYYQAAYRCFNKAFLKRKKSLAHGGALIAVTGLDGAGKSTLVWELHRWLGAHFDARLLHVGRPAARLETLPFRVALWLRKRLRGNSGPASGGPEKHSTTFSLRYLVLAYERFQLLKRAQRLRAKGYIVLCDRYPSLTPGKMDSPRLTITADHSFLNRIARMEQRLYNALPTPDVIYDLRVPFEVALSRNRERYKNDKETDEELRKRHLENADLHYLTHHFEIVDSTRSLPDVLQEVREKLWARL
jgi:thymidylate kinase